MDLKKDKYYAKSVGLDSDNELFLILPNGSSINISDDQFLMLRKLFLESRE